MEKLIKTIFSGKTNVVKEIHGGMMNKSFLLENDKKKYILYIPTEQANEMVNRKLEKEGIDLAYQLGITNKNVYFDLVSGIKANEFILGESLNNISSFSPSSVAELLKTLHKSPKKLSTDYQPFARFIDYERQVNSSDKSQDYIAIKDLIFNNKDYLLSQPLTLCHNDAQKSNIVVNSEGEYFLIDFEFVGNNDPIYDIAAFGNNSVQEGVEVLKSYFNNDPSFQEYERYYLWRMFISLQWHNVALIKEERGESLIHQIDFKQIARFFLANAKEAYIAYKNLHTRI